MPTFENANLNLEYSLECGQTFRWKKLDDGFYYGVWGDTFIRIRQDGTRFSYDTAPQAANYAALAACFQLEQDANYQQILAAIRTDASIGKAIDRYKGLRLMRQPAFEVLISFILAANNTIPVVARTVQAISKKYGQAIVLGKYRGYTFPSPATLAEVGEAELHQELGAEYRAKYIRKTCRQIADEGLDLETLATLPYDFALGKLTTFPGVGRSVADYTLLFALGQYEAFPLDFWVKRALETFYFNGQKTSDKEMRRLAVRLWGANAGYANEFLYMYARNYMRG